MCRGVGLHVIVRIEIAVERLHCRFNIAMQERALGALCTHRCRADTEESKAYIRQALALRFGAGGETGHGVIAVTAGEFREPDARVLHRSRNADRGEYFVRTKRRLEQALEEVVGLHDAPALGANNLDLATQRQQAGWQFRRRIGKSDRAAKRAAIADRGVADVRHGKRDQRRVLGDIG